MKVNVVFALVKITYVLAKLAIGWGWVGAGVVLAEHKEWPGRAIQ